MLVLLSYRISREASQRPNFVELPLLEFRIHCNTQYPPTPNMPSALGKRKSRTQEAESSVSEEEARAIFQRHFEAQFEPLPSTGTSKPAQQGAILDHYEDTLDASDSDESWGGLSSSSSSPSSPVSEVEVVSYEKATPTSNNDATSKREARAYLSSRVPTANSDSRPSASAKNGKSTGTGDSSTAEEDAPTLLKNDLSLQRLLSESHLFSPAGGASSMEHTGRNRHLATDLRVQALGSRGSVFTQAKMPMAHRKGIVAAATNREAKRRREARANDIILERPSSKPNPLASAAAASKKQKKKSGAAHRERAVDAPAVGKMSHGMLKLSKKDVADIEGNGNSGGRRKAGAGKFSGKKGRRK